MGGHHAIEGDEDTLRCVARLGTRVDLGPRTEWHRVNALLWIVHQGIDKREEVAYRPRSLFLPERVFIEIEIDDEVSGAPEIVHLEPDFVMRVAEPGVHPVRIHREIGELAQTRSDEVENGSVGAGACSRAGPHDHVAHHLHRATRDLPGEGLEGLSLLPSRTERVELDEQAQRLALLGRGAVVPRHAESHRIRVAQPSQPGGRHRGEHREL